MWNRVRRSASRPAPLAVSSALAAPPAPLLGQAPLLGLVLLLGLACGCRDQANSPEAAVRALLEAARSGDRPRVAKLLSPRARAELEQRARQATVLAGAQRALAAHDLIAAGWSQPAWEAHSVRTLRHDKEQAVVEVLSRQGRRAEVTLVREGAEWKVELPRPPH
jgi:hypothetical protein